MENFEEIIQTTVEKTEQKPKSPIKAIIWAIVFAMTIAIVAYSIYFTRSYSLVPIKGSSMENTFVDGDVVLAKNSSKVNRGDVVIISGEGKTTINGSYLIIKRVIAIGGDTVKFMDGKVYLKKAGETEFSIIEEEYIKEQDSTFFPDATNEEDVEESEEITVDEGEIFYLGDNRKVSHDSRSPDFFTCKQEQIVGVVSEKMIEKKESTKKYYNFTKNIQSIFNKGENN